MGEIKTLSYEDYLQRMLAAERPGAEKVLAFTDYRVGAICKDPRLMLCPLDDHLVHRGDGIFETVKYIDRKVYLLDKHMQRMKNSAESIKLLPPCSWEKVRDLILDTARAGGEDNGLVRVLLGRGPGGFGIDPHECPKPSLYIAAYKFKPKPEEFYTKGTTACRAVIPAKQDWLAKIKSVNYLPNALMRLDAAEKGCDYTLCFDEQGFLAEGAIENVGLLENSGTLVIPEFTNALPGTTLLRALDLIKGDPPVMFRPVREQEIFDARELMTFGTTGDCVSIVRYEGRPIHDARPGKLAARIRGLLREDLQENGLPL